MSGNGNHGTLQGATLPSLTADRFGNPNSAYQFGGYYNPNWIYVPNSSSLQFNKRFSISLWFKQCTFGGMDGWGGYSPTGYNILYGKAGDGYAAAPGLYSGTSTNSGQLNVNFSNKLCYGSAPSCYQFTMNTNLLCFDPCEWVHVVQVIDSHISRLYINGMLRDSSMLNGPANFSEANTKPLYIGKMDGSWYPFQGAIDDISIYNVALTPAQIAMLQGGYVDPLDANYQIGITAVTVSGSQCAGSTDNSITISPNLSVNPGPFQYAINGGAWQPTGTFSSLPTGSHLISIKTACTQKDTVITFGTDCASVCDTGKWVGWFNSMSAPNQYLNASQFINGGTCYAPPSLSPWSYYWSNFKFKDTLCITSNFSVEFKIKTGPPEGISAYDTWIRLYTTGGMCSITMMGDAWGQPWTSLSVMGTTLLSNSPLLIFPSLYDWTTVKMEFQDNILNYYVNGTLAYSATYTGDVCNIYSMEWGCKGSGYCDWIKVQDAFGTYVYEENFDSCAAIISFPANCNPITAHVTAVTPTCFNDTLYLFGTVTPDSSLVTYQWTGPDGFSSAAQNPVILGATAAQSGVYILQAMVNVCQPIATDTLLINVAPGGIIQTTYSLTKCASELPFVWNGIPIPAGSATHPVFATWTGTAANGCDSVVKLNLTVNPLPVLTISPADTAFCAGQSATLTAHGAQLYHWSPAAALDVDTGAVVQTTPSATTAYTLTGTDVNGCTNTASARVTIFQAYPKTVVPVTVCSDSVFIFNEQPFIAAGDYTIRMTAQNGCDSLILLQLRRKEAPVAAFAIPEHVCVNQPLPVVASHVSVPAEYAWDFDGAQIQYGQSAGPYGVIWTTPGTRRVTFTISSPPCPPVAVAHDIEVMPLPLADIYMAQEGTICIGDKIALQTTYEPRYRYQWLPAGFFEDPHSDRATAVLRASGYITLQVTDPYGCVAADSVYVAGEPCCTVTMPNAFSPNSDGRNDYFRPITRGHQQIAAFRVMNRWGQTVFETLQQDKGWDGTLGGVPQEVGTYMYFLRYRCADGEFYEKKGEVILLR